MTHSREPDLPRSPAPAASAVPPPRKWIARCARLRTSRHFVVGLHLAALCGALAWWGFWWTHVKRLQVVREGVLYRTAQPTEFGMDWLVKQRGVRTIISLRLEDPLLTPGLIGGDRSRGQRESEYVASLGANPVQWPMGEEACWPWVSPWQFEEFFKLFDEPANFPVAFHCVGGRHRTGTMAALFRLEYDRWPVERTLAEMNSFEFGTFISLQTHNLRTYLPRPRPNEEQFRALLRTFADLLPGDPPADYQELVRRLRKSDRPDDVTSRARDYLRDGGAFALPLAARLLDGPDQPLAPFAAWAADKCLRRTDADATDWAVSAALVADFGDTIQQEQLLALLRDEPRNGPPTPRYQAIVAGVTNRYTPNRIVYWLPLLDDMRPRPEPDAATYRYCDTAVARLSATIDQNLLQPNWVWDDGRQRATEWFADHPEAIRLTQLQPAPGRKLVHTALSPADEDRDIWRD